MNIREFGSEYRVPIKFCPDDSTLIVPGNEGHSHIFDYGGGLFGVMVMPDTRRADRWQAARLAFSAAGMTIRQDGDGEGVATFSPNRADQVRLAMRYARVRCRRKISEVQRERLSEFAFEKKV
jgi:hypothetical protein